MFKLQLFKSHITFTKGHIWHHTWSFILPAELETDDYSDCQSLSEQSDFSEIGEFTNWSVLSFFMTKFYQWCINSSDYECMHKWTHQFVERGTGESQFVKLFSCITLYNYRREWQHYCFIRSCCSTTETCNRSLSHARSIVYCHFNMLLFVQFSLVSVVV